MLPGFCLDLPLISLHPVFPTPPLHGCSSAYLRKLTFRLQSQSHSHSSPLPVSLSLFPSPSFRTNILQCSKPFRVSCTLSLPFFSLPPTPLSPPPLSLPLPPLSPFPLSPPPLSLPLPPPLPLPLSGGMPCYLARPVTDSDQKSDGVDLESSGQLPPHTLFVLHKISHSV